MTKISEILLKEGFVEVSQNQLRGGIFKELIEYYGNEEDDNLPKSWRHYVKW